MTRQPLGNATHPGELAKITSFQPLARCPGSWFFNQQAVSRPVMKPLAWIFGAGVGLRNSLYSHGLLKQHRLRGPTISIGNLSVGGSGKTPFVLLLGDLLRSRRLSFDVLSRGYGRRSKGVLEVNAGGSAQDFGDEPLLIARKLGVPVILGEDRYQAGVFAEEKFARHMHLLDDGFQHRALARDFDIVLVTAEDARDSLLPAGRLREPLSSLSRADAVVLTSGASTDSFPLDGKQVWRVRRGISLPMVPDRAVAFCGIARPKSFFLQLQKAGVDVVAEAVEMQRVTGVSRQRVGVETHRVSVCQINRHLALPDESRERRVTLLVLKVAPDERAAAHDEP